MNIRGLDYKDYFNKAFNQNEEFKKGLEEKSEVIAKIYKNEKAENYFDKNKEWKKQEFIKLVNDALSKDRLKVESEIHEFFGDNIIKIVDTVTGKIVSEVPSKALLDMVAEFCKNAGILIDEKA